MFQDILLVIKTFTQEVGQNPVTKNTLTNPHQVFLCLNPDSVITRENINRNKWKVVT